MNILKDLFNPILFEMLYYKKKKIEKKRDPKTVSKVE